MPAPPRPAHRVAGPALAVARRRPEEPAQHRLPRGPAAPPAPRHGRATRRGTASRRMRPLGPPRPASVRPRSGAERSGPAMARSLNSIVAVSQNMGIGKDGRLPWPSLRYRGPPPLGPPSIPSSTTAPSVPRAARQQAGAAGPRGARWEL